MAESTEYRIQQLCSEAIAAKNKEEVERVIGELRLTLEEQVRRARGSVAEEAMAMSFANTATERSWSTIDAIRAKLLNSARLSSPSGTGSNNIA